MPISGKKMVKLFLLHGWRFERQTGSHVIVSKGSQVECIPVHGNKDLRKGLERALLKRLKEGNTK